MQRRFLRIIIIATTIITTTTTTITIITVTTTTHKHTGLTNKKACPGFLATGSLLAGFCLTGREWPKQAPGGQPPSPDQGSRVERDQDAKAAVSGWRKTSRHDLPAPAPGDGGFYRRLRNRLATSPTTTSPTAAAVAG